MIACAIGGPLASADSTKIPPANTDGSYSVKVRGFCEGTGQAAVTGGTLSISASVTDEEGHTGTLTVNDVTVDETNHFSGAGTILGKSMTISGRLDAIDSAETLLKTARITANFTISDGHHGRVAGFVPITPGGTTPGAGGTSPGSPPPGGTSPGGPPPDHGGSPGGPPKGGDRSGRGPGRN